MNQRHIVWVLILLVASVQISFGHGGHKKKKAPTDSVRHDSVMISAQPMTYASAADHSMTRDESQVMAPMTAPVADYPTYHPMVVHAPIILLLLAALLQLVALINPSSPLNWLTLLIALGGTVGAYIAGTLVHPHTDGLSDAAQVALETHETYADYTLWLGLAGTLLKGATLWRPLKWLEGVTAIVLVGAGIAVGLAGHQGGALTYLYGIGPRGAYLEQHDEGTADGNRHEHNHSDEAK
ncbi:hypothetical protein J2I47_21730 [Fibrella sp. HMF5335]|uniref:DUF2231 domain-containing protein n=1 Tax=Fibrella rubiginis TaxID=2817060 RepID=A0A939K7A1_9BACT|nr:DUF2231 domain-containing protein [Fibrella rubiginis]MBO0939191.1 hypothetical protein [Fibrella rubiginis]